MCAEPGIGGFRVAETVSAIYTVSASFFTSQSAETQSRKGTKTQKKNYYCGKNFPVLRKKNPLCLRPFDRAYFFDKFFSRKLLQTKNLSIVLPAAFISGTGIAH
ncbi:MAG: hypothetical protein JW804_07070 [Sedimentisphaerales bacterium]|nr:hypothetical protein [Sedimentisphaerales bacterium]